MIQQYKKTPLISIIIPNYNRGSMIAETLGSVSLQTYENWELIIVDDGSTDNSLEVIKPFLEDTRIKYVQRPLGRLPGGNAARNYGYEISNGDYIKWLDSDDLLEPRCLELQLKKIMADRSDVCFCRSRFFSTQSEINQIIKGNYWHDNFKSSDNLLEDFILGKVRFSNNDGLWRRNVLPAQPYYENLKNSQEFLMITIMLTKGIRVGMIDDVLILVRTHSDQMADNRVYSIYSKNQILARYLVIKELVKYKNKNARIHNYLLKSIIYYIFQSVKKGEFKYLHKNFILFSKSILIKINL